MSDENSQAAADADADAVAGAIWGGAVALLNSADKGQAAANRIALGDLVRNAVGGDPTPTVYVTQLNATGYRNQIWQGQGNTRPHKVMVLVDKSGNEAGVAAEASKRLSPPMENGFDAAVICEPDGAGWKIHKVIEYDHSDIGAKLKALVTGASFDVERVADPGTDREILRTGVAQPPEAPLDAAEVVLHLSEAKNVVLEGPPGTGKTHLAFGALSYMAEGDHDLGRLERILRGRPLHDIPNAELNAPAVAWEFVQFHPAYSYEDFVRGLKTDPAATGFSLRSVDGVLPTMCQLAERRVGKPTVLIIDEINRCNMASVLGETIFAIDPAHRGRDVTLQYEPPSSGSRNLAVPSNLFIIGTMNTADRSTAMLDYAIRRRFRFLTVPPSVEALRSHYAARPERAEKMVALFQAVIAAVPEPDLKPGHSYFMVKNHEALDSGAFMRAIIPKILHEVRPLLTEYAEEGRLAAGVRITLGNVVLQPILDAEAVLEERLRTVLAEDGAQP